MRCGGLPSVAYRDQIPHGRQTALWGEPGLCSGRSALAGRTGEAGVLGNRSSSQPNAPHSLYSIADSHMEEGLEVA
ncbi:hypothetical protein AAFF_G00349810 [Aldrovandia affinis]|uniref:Uncharacterized protein n=1 Tax=Aldrovandia affinis TaxID=143900 RepID=A0AAD7SJ91_9TELE|nr:hypothetical protein AAFF_G00349810 [Aldrovandia affinis]